ncbi:MAG: CPBP family intramembrane metalloprotease [Sedimentisphaerales bacterium]|nr:CPBP family intramembrane metalloprotease [Sedimentisphaerales bacterium]
MENKYSRSASQLLNFTQDSYLERTSRPVYAVIFLLPFIVFYELGTVLINTDILNQSQVRVVAFVWLQKALEYVGFSHKIAWMLPPLVVIIILISLQITSCKKWSFGLGDIWPMAMECILLAGPLIVLSLFLNSSEQPTPNATTIAESGLPYAQAQATLNCLSPAAIPLQTAVKYYQADTNNLLANIITGIGAGIYEELVFRLILICVLMIVFQDVLKIARKNSIVFSVLLSAALFSAHHHIIFIDGRLTTNVPFDGTVFCFRTIAGVYFAILFAVRGFGVTAGTHAFYDIIATIINTLFFQQ